MKKSILILCLVFFCLLKSSNVVGQQLLWTSSSEIKEATYLPNDRIKEKVMEYYDNNKYFFDKTGYDINYFLKIFKLDSKIGSYKKKMNERNIKKLIFCVKTNPGDGSVISLLILGDKTFDMVSFSEVISSGSQRTEPEDIKIRTKFEKWIDGILN
jgi:hypothetical protein